MTSPATATNRACNPAGDDPAVAKRAFEAMMTMQKIDHAAIAAAIAGE